MFESLNDAQRRAVLHDPNIPLQILAGPGSGKTKVLTSRIAYLVRHHGVAPTSICAVTFTNKAANELKSRLANLIGQDASQRLVMGTFHALCARFLRKWGKVISIEKNFSICDAEESKKILAKLLKGHEDDIKALPDPFKEGYALSFISKAKSKGLNPTQVAMQQQQAHYTNEADQIMQSIYEGYEQVLKKSNSLDFDDLLCYGVKLFERNPDLAHWCHHVLVDEFQDTNPIQYKLMLRIANYRGCVTIVGDPDQSIYGWRSADFPNCHQIFLEQNYRSTASILASSLAIVSQDTNRIAKTLIATHEGGHMPVLRAFESEELETNGIALEIKRLMAYTGGMLAFRDFAILLRFNALSRAIESSLQKQLIPYRVVGGQRFFERMEVKDILSYLYLVDNPLNESAFARVINLPARKIGDKSISEISKYAAKLGCSSLDIVLKIQQGKIQDISPPVRKKLSGFVKVILALRKMLKEDAPVADLVQLVVDDTSYEEHLKRTQKDFDSRWENVQELINFATQFRPLEEGKYDDDFDDFDDADRFDEPQSAFQAFLQASNLSSETEVSGAESEQNFVIITTCHSAKGLEWPVVFIPAVERGVFPFSRSEDIAEERRLLYVACTRAKLFLHLSYCSSRMTAGETKRKELSDFLRITMPDRHSLFASNVPPIEPKDLPTVGNILGRPLPDEAEMRKLKRKFDLRTKREYSMREAISSASVQVGSTAPDTVTFIRPSMTPTPLVTVAKESGQTHIKEENTSSQTTLGKLPYRAISEQKRPLVYDTRSTLFNTMHRAVVPRTATKTEAAKSGGIDIAVSGDPLKATLTTTAKVGTKRLGLGRMMTPYQPPTKRTKS